MRQITAVVAHMLLCLGLVDPGPARAQTDEIQVYDAGIVAPGHFGFTLHNNFTPSGRTTAEIPGGVVPRHSLNGVPEFAYGLRNWWEIGAYLPVYSLTGDGRLLIDSVKLRSLFVVPDADTRSFFYGVNFELSLNARHWDQQRISGEIRPIVGWRIGKVDFVINPILDTGFNGVSRLDFAPSARLAYNFNEGFALALEHYADFGPIGNWAHGQDQSHTLFAVIDHRIKALELEFGIGHGLTAAADNLVIKLMLSRSF